KETSMADSASGGNERAFAFLKTNERAPKPRVTGVTEIRGPYYTPMGSHYLEDILETMGAYVDTLKFAGGAFSRMPRRVLRGRIGGGGHTGRRLGRHPGAALPRRRGGHDHDRVGRNYRERKDLADRRRRPDHRRPGPGEGDVRGGRPGSLWLVRQELRAGGK